MYKEMGKMGTSKLTLSSVYNFLIASKILEVIVFISSHFQMKTKSLPNDIFDMNIEIKRTHTLSTNLEKVTKHKVVV